MKIQLPDLDFGPSNVAKNRDAIDQAIAAYKGAIKTLEGLHVANQGQCKHPKATNHYDPGYAGGGYDYTTCDVCRAKVPYREPYRVR